MSQTTKRAWKQKLTKTTNIFVNVTLVAYMCSASFLVAAPAGQAENDTFSLDLPIMEVQQEDESKVEVDPVPVGDFSLNLPQEDKLDLPQEDKVEGKDQEPNERASVSVIAPNGGEVWSGTQDIVWHYQYNDWGPFDYSLYYKEGNCNGAIHSWNNLANVSCGTDTCTYSVDTTAVPNGQYCIGIRKTSGNYKEDKSDGTFEINNTTCPVIFDDSFEANNFNKWTSHDNDWRISHGSGHPGNRKAYVCDQGSSADILLKEFPTDGKDTVNLKYNYRAQHPLENHDHVYVQWYDGTHWNTLADYHNLSSGGWTSASHSLPVEASDNPNFKIRFKATGLEKCSGCCGDKDQFQLDGVELTACTSAYCGDGEVNQDWEKCDGDDPQACTTQDEYAGTQMCIMPGSRPAGICTWDDCVPTEYCGDDIKNGTEECDDGNSTSGDGCDSECKEEEYITVIAHKIVCEDEADLPNWGVVSGDQNISNWFDSGEADQWVAEKEGCQFASGWEFEWGPKTAGNPGDEHYGHGGGQWTTFGPTDGTGATKTTFYQNDVTDPLKFREVLKPGYLPFTYGPYGGDGNNVSAEFYCDDDNHHYDNYDYINGPMMGNTYHCVGFNAPEYSIHGYKWNDLNGNEQRDCSDDIRDCEELLPGWTIFIDENDNGTLDSGETSTVTEDTCHLGWYWFEGLPAGTYNICEVNQTGWTQTYPDNCHEVTLPDNNPSGMKVSDNAVSGPEYNFGNRELGSLTLCKYQDMDEDGIKDPEDTTITGWPMYYMPDQIGRGYSQEWIEVPTEFDGCVTIDLPFGDYLYKEWQPEGWIQTMPGCPEPYHISINGDNLNPTRDFLNFYPGMIAGYKYNELETPLPDWEICYERYYEEGGDEIRSATTVLPEKVCTTTNEDGYYEFTGLHAGQYKITEEMQPGWAVMEPAIGYHIATIQSATGIDTELVFHNFMNYLLPFCGDGEVNQEFEECDLEDGVGFNQICNDDCGLETVVEDPLLTLDKTDDVDPVTEGDTFRYTMDWAVTQGYAIHLTLEDPLPAELIYVDSDGGTYDEATHTVTWDLGYQAAGATGSVWIDVEVTTGLDDGTVLNNEAELSTEYEIVEGEEEETEVEVMTAAAVNRRMIAVATSAVEDTTVTALPDLSLLKSVDTTVTNPGKTVAYTVTINNSGKGLAENVNITDMLPAGLYFYEDGKNTGERAKTFKVGDLAAGEDYSVKYLVYLDSNLGEGEYDNVATGMADNHKDVTDDAKVDVRVPTVLGEETGARLTIAKSVDKEIVNPGGTATYTVVVTNEGEGVAMNTNLLDVLPDGFTFSETASYTHSWDLGDLVPDESKEITYEVKVDASQTEGKYLNLAVVSADDVEDVSDKVSLEVRQGLVLGAEDDLTDTGAGAWDWLVAVFALILIAGGISVYSFASKKA